MTLSLRERVLVEVQARLEKEFGAGQVPRLALFTRPAGSLPAFTIVDGREVRPSPSDPAANEQGGGGGYVRMAPVLRILARTERDEDLPPLLNDLMARAIAALGRDSATGDPDPSLGGLVQWCVCLGCADQGAALSDDTLPTVLRDVTLELARPEAELDPYRQA